MWGHIGGQVSCWWNTSFMMLIWDRQDSDIHFRSAYPSGSALIKFVQTTFVNTSAFLLFKVNVDLLNEALFLLSFSLICFSFEVPSQTSDQLEIFVFSKCKTQTRNKHFSDKMACSQFSFSHQHKNKRYMWFHIASEMILKIKTHSSTRTHTHTCTHRQGTRRWYRFVDRCRNKQLLFYPPSGQKQKKNWRRLSLTLMLVCLQMTINSLFTLTHNTIGV